MAVLNDSKQKRTHKLTPSERAQVLEKAPVEGVSAVARRYGVTPSAVSQLLSNREEAFAEIQAEREQTAIRHALDDKDAMVSVMCEGARAILENFAHYDPHTQTYDMTRMRVAGKDAQAVKDAKDVLMAAAKLRGWDVNKQEHSGPGGEVLRVEEVKRVIVSRS